MAFLEIKGLEKEYKDFTLSLSMAIEEGEFISLIGPSGSGKSTLLSVIAGILPPDRGEILLSGDDITGRRIQDRGIGMVFQDIALFPSMNEKKNIQAGMKEKDRKKRNELAEKLLDLVGLPGYGKRSISSLSGGEAQRVALARSIAAEPRILLLDEPLSSLDAPLRKHLRAAIEAFGTAEELYRKPSNLFTAFFTGEGTAIPASVLSEGASGTLFFRPENAQIADLDADSSSFPRHMIFRNAEIVSAEFTGDGYTLGLDWNGFQILARSIIQPRKKDVSVIILKEAVEILNS